MCNSEMVYKNVAFNILDPDQDEQLKHAMKRKNFSAYVKRLIQRDMDNAFAPKAVYDIQPVAQEEETVEFSSNLMGSLI